MFDAFVDHVNILLKLSCIDKKDQITLELFHSRQDEPVESYNFTSFILQYRFSVGTLLLNLRFRLNIDIYAFSLLLIYCILCTLTHSRRIETLHFCHGKYMGYSMK